MSEFGNTFDFPEVEDDELDIDAIFGDAGTAETPPAPEPVSEPEETASAEPEAEQDAPANKQTPAQETASEDKSNTVGDDEPDLFAALAPKSTAATKPAKATQEAPKPMSFS